MLRWCLLLVAVVLWGCLPVWSQEKLVLMNDFPRSLGLFEVTADGSRLYFAEKGYLVIDATGALVDRFGVPNASTPKELFPLPDGWFISCNSYSQGHIGLVRPDGTTARRLVGKGGDIKVFRSDMTGWTSPNGAAVDPVNKLIFTIDTSQAGPGFADPIWSRIAVHDFDGKYIRDINRYDGKAADGTAEKDEARRTWYNDIEVDSVRKRVYITMRNNGGLLAFNYDGTPAGKAAGGGAIAVFPDGRVATAIGNDTVIYSPELEKLTSLRITGVSDLETDAAGRLYVSNSSDPSIIFTRWAADLQTSEVVRPLYQRIKVTFPTTVPKSAETMAIKVELEGNPMPARQDVWTVYARPADGSSTQWQRWEATYDNGTLQVKTPAKSSGIFDMAVRFGDAALDRASRANDLFVQRTVAVLPVGAVRSVAAFPVSGRRVYQQGEAIALALVRRYDSKVEPVGEVKLQMELAQGGVPLSSIPVTMDSRYYASIPAAFTRRLAPGEYQLTPQLEGHECYPLTLTIATTLPDSPMQRILYHEFGGDPFGNINEYQDAVERFSFLQEYARTIKEMGFTRETDRTVGKMANPAMWSRQSAPTALTENGFAPAEYYSLMQQGGWQYDYYFDQMVKYGIRYDSQLLPHCGGVRFRDEVLNPLNAQLQRFTQYAGRYPTFYGFNYNDEAFFGGWANPWAKEDSDYIKELREGEFAGRPYPEVLIHAFDLMYSSFNGAVRRVKPDIKVTSTPMWQFFAAEGSYAPALYKDMSESYSHYISEGYHVPWYASHSAALLRRPGLPLMAVIDNQYGSRDGDIYAKNVMQVLARGAQGTGVAHTAPFEAGIGTNYIRTTNQLAKIYGPVFADFPPLNDGAILYSYTQDITEKRVNFGTPQWNRVYELHSAGQMAGVPMTIIYEEDLTAGWLLVTGKPRVPMLFLVGLTQKLPENVLSAITKYAAAGGTVVIDADTQNFPGAIKLPFSTWQLQSAWSEGNDADTWQPLMYPILEKEARDLRAAVGQFRPYPVDSIDPWVGKSQFDGGAVRYLMFVNESSHYPWEVGQTWSIGAMYAKSALTFRPKKSEVSFPAGKGVVYDLFNQSIVTPAADKTRTMTVDLTSFPARLYALAPAELGAPRLSTALQGEMLSVKAEVLDDQGKAMAARVPLRIRLLYGPAVAQEIYRGTDKTGLFSTMFTMPVNDEQCTVEVTEMLGGKASAATVKSLALQTKLLQDSTAVVVQREDRIRLLLNDAKAKGALTLALGNANQLNAEQLAQLSAELGKKGITLKIDEPTPKTATAGIYLALGSRQGNQLGDILAQSVNKGILDIAVSDNVPGPGRGLISAVFAPRGFQEDAIVLLGGDNAGLQLTVQTFIAWLQPNPGIAKAMAALPPLQYSNNGKPTQVPAVPRLGDELGARLSQIVLTPDSKRLLVGADGFMKNIALLEDTGTQAKLVRAERLGQAPQPQSLFITDDGKTFGMASRVVSRYGEALFATDAATGATQAFAAYGVMDKGAHRFSMSADGKTVVTGGVYGVVCWQRQGNTWKEAWSYDYWKDFSKMEWPVSPDKERMPQFHALIPSGADYALVCFGETSNNAWVTPENMASASLMALNLSDGKVRWTFDVPIKDLLFPTLHSSPNGAKTLLQVQISSWRKETFRFYVVENGKASAWWNSPTAPLSVAISDISGNIAGAYKNQALEMRRPDGTVAFSQLWRCQPLGLAFAADGQSLLVVDDSGMLTRLDSKGSILWKQEVPACSTVAASRDRIYVGAWSGRVSAFSMDGAPIWSYDCTPVLSETKPMTLVSNADVLPAGALFQAKRHSTTTAQIPTGENLLAGAVAGKFKVLDTADGKVKEMTATGNAQAVLRVNGTGGWKSQGKVLVQAEALTNGKTDDVTTPWLHINEVFWAAGAGRQVWAEITFTQPTDVSSLTVYENPNQPESWPTDAVVQGWNPEQQRWDTATYGVFLTGAVNSYTLNLKAVTKVRYVPWASYYRNFYTSEIEVRGAVAD